ncbi:hypothetical protein Taro_048070 [Colocasia esculenta]|uniref:Uncharacterized protein n=1 Tax=Colocasia esculenta TaxID=4460 RepID=A0A843X642_COLES|nr:hypothetical protein [Colocasia esculenta]
MMTAKIAVDEVEVKIPFYTVRYGCISGLKLSRGNIVVQASNINIGAGGYEGSGDNDGSKMYNNGSTSETSSKP